MDRDARHYGGAKPDTRTELERQTGSVGVVGSETEQVEGETDCIRVYVTLDHGVTNDPPAIFAPRRVSLQLEVGWAALA